MLSIAVNCIRCVLCGSDLTDNTDTEERSRSLAYHITTQCQWQPFPTTWLYGNRVVVFSSSKVDNWTCDEIRKVLYLFEDIAVSMFWLTIAFTVGRVYAHYLNTSKVIARPALVKKNAFVVTQWQGLPVVRVAAIITNYWCQYWWRHSHTLFSAIDSLPTLITYISSNYAWSLSRLNYCHDISDTLINRISQICSLQLLTI